MANKDFRDYVDNVRLMSKGGFLNPMRDWPDWQRIKDNPNLEIPEKEYLKAVGQVNFAFNGKAI